MGPVGWKVTKHLICQPLNRASIDIWGPNSLIKWAWYMGGTWGKKPVETLVLPGSQSRPSGKGKYVHLVFPSALNTAMDFWCQGGDKGLLDWENSSVDLTNWVADMGHN